MQPTSHDLEEFESPEEHRARYKQAYQDLQRQKLQSAQDAQKAAELRKILHDPAPNPNDVTDNPLWMMLRIFPKGFVVDYLGRIASIENEGITGASSTKLITRTSILYVRCPPG
jgi:hypothetical protein